MRIIVGADHAGFPLKGLVVDTLRSWGHEVEDVGTHDGQPIDFPDVARSVCDPVRTGHLFYAAAPREPGEIRVEATDRWGRTYSEVLR